MMAEKDIIIGTQENAGEIKISNDVVVVIASQALNEIKGVHLAASAAEGIVDKLVKKTTQRGIRIYINEEEKNADMDVHISIDYGKNIPEICWTVQDAVKKNVESMTDLSIGKVNVFVDGVTVEKEPKLPKVKKVKETEKSGVGETKSDNNEVK